MLRLKNIAVGEKLLVLILLLLGAVMTVGLTSYRGIQLLGALNQQSEQQQEMVRSMTSAERSYDAIRAVVFRALVATQTGDATELSATSEELPIVASSVTGTLETLATAPLEQETKDTLARIRTDVMAYLTKAQDIVTLAQGNDRTRAMEGLPQFRDAFTKAGEGLQELGLLVRGGTSFMTAQSEETAATATKTVSIVFVIAAILAVVLGWTITSSITKPLAKMTLAASRIADGDICATDRPCLKRRVRRPRRRVP